LLVICYIDTLLHCPRFSQYDCCLPFPCIHAQTMQHCQHPHTASNFSSLTWAGQQSATLCLWCSRMKTTNVLRHLLVPQNPHLAIYNKTFHCEVIFHVCQSLSSSDNRKDETWPYRGRPFWQVQSTQTRQKIAMHVCCFSQRRRSKMSNICSLHRSIMQLCLPNVHCPTNHLQLHRTSNAWWMPQFHVSNASAIATLQIDHS
jgi:hypothetical protein